MITIFILDVPEFSSVVAAARSAPECEVSTSELGYFIIRSPAPITFSRRALGLKPAIWYGIPTGGMIGRISKFDRDELIIELNE